MKIALVMPEWKFENPYPPLGLAYIAAVLERNNYDVRIFDLTLEDNKPFETRVKEIIDFSPEIVGISAMSHNYINASKVALRIKTMTKASIVFGGPHPTIMPEEVLKNENIDLVIMGEGEDIFLKLCQNYQNKEFYGIDGLCFKDNNEIIVQPKKQFIENLDEIPFPARHLLKFDSYTLVDDYGNKMVTIMSSRGCPYGCTYCYKGLFGKTYRQRSSQNIVDEIKYCVNKFGSKSFYFIDDLFTLNLKRVEELTDTIKKEDIDIRWQCLARVNNATPQMFRKMKESGCYKVHFGIESGNQNILNKVKKGITLDQVRDAVKYCKDTNIKTKGYFMIGMPGDTKETMQDTLDFADELKLDEVMFSITTPFPGTELWKTIDKDKIKSLSDAFYYSCDSDDISIFYNLSNVSDSDIIDIVGKTRHMTDNINAKIFCERSFGKRIGFLAWQLCKISFLKKTGKMLLHITR